ncbi:unnamed protein product [Allacma fusca]|uniref:Uncharacterized protein n=1 Tax=Allacma fusca TaxID=39272 RepID=A0A8J2JEQ3_9HEXA|nr:unnamed protein product [Allacma fusca]
MNFNFKIKISILLLFCAVLLISQASSTDTKDLSLQPSEFSEVMKIPGLASLEDILKALETITGLKVGLILLQLQATLEGILTGFTVTIAEIFILLINNKLLEHVAFNILDLINGAILYTQTSVSQAMDLLGWMMSIAEVTEELQPILTAMIVGTYLFPTFLEGLAASLVDVVAKEAPTVSEELKEMFSCLESNVTADINSLLRTMLPDQHETLIQLERDEF